jgi:hypothetical protein
MIKKIFSFLLISAFYLPLSSFASSVLTGTELLKACEVVLDIHDKNMGRVQTENEYLQGTKAGLCEGYLRGVNEMRKSACSFNNNDKLLTVAAVVKYLKTNSEQLYMPASVLVVKAYARYFHC